METNGLRKWAILKVGFPPQGEIISSSLSSKMVSNGSTIFWVSTISQMGQILRKKVAGVFSDKNKVAGVNGTVLVLISLVSYLISDMLGQHHHTLFRHAKVA